MATPTFFNNFKQYGMDGTIDLDDDQFDMYLSNAAPSVSADSVKADLAGITEQNGYTETTLTLTWATDAGTGFRLANDADESWTASGGSFGPFQYVVIFDETVATPVVDPLMLWWDVGSATTITTGNTFTVDLDANFEIFTLDS
jgi:hypothetical protein